MDDSIMDILLKTAIDDFEITALELAKPDILNVKTFKKAYKYQVFKTEVSKQLAKENIKKAEMIRKDIKMDLELLMQVIIKDKTQK